MTAEAGVCPTAATIVHLTLTHQLALAQVILLTALITLPQERLQQPTAILQQEVITTTLPTARQVITALLPLITPLTLLLVLCLVQDQNLPHLVNVHQGTIG